MRAIISTTYSDTYLYFLPITTWCWNKLGVDVICFLPYKSENLHSDKMDLVIDSVSEQQLKVRLKFFHAPEHKEATYAQCSRLYGACLDLPEGEVLVTGDVDMAVFQLPPYIEGFTVFGSDLVPDKQMPICYISAKVKDWRKAFDIESKTYQQCLDELLGHIEALHFRGNYWGKDQETVYNKIAPDQTIWSFPRAREGTQFASKRYDRDDAYLLDRLSPDTIDYHMPRPGYEDAAFNQILTVLKFHYPNDDFAWLINYTEQYKALL